MALTPEEMSKRAALLRAKISQKASPVDTVKSQHGMAIRIAIELIASVFVGTAIGWFIYDWLNTTPLFLIICLIIGTIAGFVTIKRVNDAFAKSLENSEE